ncbi:MAG: hypothetical protein A3F82_06345 [Deltaproteobacteria bacterium RIFCSPLOWO2_12_FULL_44_12]|nr:MAG: hypothetical protein A2712_00960 [Deltaproteobacteria bacterium RIFCSPHIGHO2_01_FULL_43_49]OGQ15292.1 MAG: hypothetical protein A3D22_04515 [Deltaproteobacteria bacterium RIFCSPHIGHO2_02_FULL_44_53]OGQ27084.1 MAG: hypothetical protein A3D98_01550 [Deltaproteobacteria bacterium RIFCSPHIGHO2_12_FULL_44_21]OGQ31808.1 MAG: hypothetical protein A2979_05675 [Deltaproteobacteria bacterium RIFCSPLOWO2_01_FULL_45_74]OGQ43010.1 MAG: hypothetical protein A3I70_07980 [Deltaproteobacteria bacterium 
MRRGEGKVLGFIVFAVSIILFAPTTFAAPKSKTRKTEKKEPLAASAMVGDSVCQNCHEDQLAKFNKTLMAKYLYSKTKSGKETFACETCHGPGRAHSEAGGGRGVGNLITFGKGATTPAEKQNAVCLQCHSGNDRFFWNGSPHDSKEVACTSCHKVMENATERFQLSKSSEIETCGQCHQQKRAQRMRYSHMPLRENKMKCTSCHSPHGSVSDKLLKGNSINEMCYSCHAEKRGPFLWEHAPVAESCTNCHDPHGSNNERMLTLPKPRLCQQCHVESGHPTTPQRLTATRYLSDQACNNCHYDVHGSNHPSGKAFTR